MNWFLYLSLILVAYLIGSVSTSIWIGKLFFHLDIRNYGSGNAGAANTIRVLGWKAGLPVLLFDVFKGWLAVRLAHYSHIFPEPSEAFMTFQLFLGTAVALGHIFPVYSHFRGGKGVATFLGVTLAIALYPTLISIGVFMIVLILSNYISLSSMSAGLMFPVSVILIFKTSYLSLTIFSILIALLLVYTHRQNIRRILYHEESKASQLLHRKDKYDT